MPKIDGSRSSSSRVPVSPDHWCHGARHTPRPRTSGRSLRPLDPLPWLRPEAVLAEQRALLTDSMFARLHLNRWVAGEDRLTTPEQVAACIGHSGTIAPRRGIRYVHGLDVGLVNDRTVLTIGPP